MTQEPESVVQSAAAAVQEPLALIGEPLALIGEPVAVLAVLLGVLAGLFTLASRPWGRQFFRVVPLLIFAYFIPTALSNTDVIPRDSEFILYEMIKEWLLPASLILLTMSVDIPAILKLGKNVLILFLGGTLTIVLGGPLAYLALGWMIPPEMADQAWKGMAALSGSWIGGGANFVAIGKSVGTSDAMMGLIVVIDVALANVWMAVLLFFAGHEKRMDAALGADRSSLDELKVKIESFQKQVARATTLKDLFVILFIAIGGTVAASWAASYIEPKMAAKFPDLKNIANEFTWKVIIVTAIGVGISFTRLRNLEGAGASRIGSLFLYLLVASIGAKAEFAKVFDVPALMLICAVWIAFHAVTLLWLRHVLRAPIFYMAVGSQANIGGAASAPIVASAFHPSLAPVGALMGVAGYVLGTYAGLACAFLLRWASLCY
ncbi:MAG: DUF819 family protein [Planctomycetota bacterium]|jgi:uncharacterized membrane protein